MPAAIAIAAHPDDIEFTMGGTLALLREAGWSTHYLNIANGSGGSLVHGAAALRKIRRREAMQGAAILGAEFHESATDDLEILYTVPLLRRLVGIIRQVQPSIVLTHSPQDYMEDHTNACRLAVTATFARGIPNFPSARRRERAWSGDAVVYHAMPHGMCDQLRRRIVPGAFVDIGPVHEKKAAALACHQSQDGWLQASQHMSSLVRDMTAVDRALGRMSRKFKYAEGWRRHSHMGFGQPGADPLRAALGKKYLVNNAYERALARAI